MRYFPGVVDGFGIAFSAGMLVDAPFNEITRQIIGSAIEVHRVVGPGLLESPYAQALDSRLRVDLIIEDLVVVEIKAVETLLPIHRAQVPTYMKLTGCPAGMLINFNVGKLVDGIVRVINTRGERAEELWPATQAGSPLVKLRASSVCSVAPC